MLVEASQIGMATLLLSSPAVGLALGSDKPHEDLPSKVLLEIKPSNIAGADLGLFLAAQSPPAKQGAFLTTFGDRVVSVLDMYGTILEDYAMQIPDSPEEFRTGEPWDGEVPSVVDGATVAMGHYVNDAAAIHTPPIGAWPGPTGLIEMVDTYYAESTRMRNVGCDTDAYRGSWALVAMRDIDPGEELYLTYGTSHWLDVVLKTSPDPLLRLLVYRFQAHRSPESFDGGAYMVPDEHLRPTMADTGEPADESWCQFFLLDTLGMSGKRKEWERYGVYRKKRACDRLSAMIEMAYRDERLTPQGMEEVVVTAQR